MPATNGSNVNRVTFASLFCPACIEHIPNNAPKQDVLEQLLRCLVNAQLLIQTEVPKILNALMSRERIGSTALGKGLAFPHLRTEAVDEFVGAIGLAPEGIDFQSLDGDSTKLVLLVLGPYQQRERHFELMGRLSALLRDKTTLWFLKGRHTQDEVFEYLTELDARSGERPGSLGKPLMTAAGSQQATVVPLGGI